MYFMPLIVPVLVMVLLTFVVWARMYYLRLRDMHSGGIDPQAVATRSRLAGKLDRSEASSDNLMNLFEMPVLFYLAVLIALVLLIQDPLLVIFAWMYVLLRVAHSLIHTTYNNVLHRFYVYFASCAVLFAMWVRLAWQLF
ncbi:MAG: hypothetical protein HKN58_06705 [Xanthomonadales bacterium]|nr:hypothetical protein [Xanthomonadales bacterium]